MLLSAFYLHLQRHPHTLFLFSVLCSCSYLYFNSPKLILLHFNLINKDAYFIFIYQYLKQPYISVDTPGICTFLFLKWLPYLLELHFSCNCLSFFSFKFIVWISATLHVPYNCTHVYCHNYWFQNFQGHCHKELGKKLSSLSLIWLLTNVLPHISKIVGLLMKAASFMHTMFFFFIFVFTFTSMYTPPVSPYKSF